MKSSLRGLRAALSVAALAGGLSSPLFAAGDGWITDWEAAKKAAADQKKDLLVDFTGSDWCSWCKKLDQEVFSEAKFKEEASKKFVFVALDFPQQKELPEAEKKQNQKLQAEFSVEGFPSIYLVDSQGRPFAKTGYQPGGAEAYLKHLDEIAGAKTKRDEALAKAAGEKGIEKAKALKAALDSLGDDLGALAPYAGVLDEIKALDKDDSLGLAKAASTKKALADLEQELAGLAQDGKKKEIVAKVDEFLAKNPLEGEPKQKVLFMKLMSCGREDLDDAAALIEAVIAVDATTETGQQAASIKERIAAVKAQQATKPADDAPKKDAPKKKKAADDGEKSAQ